MSASFSVASSTGSYEVVVAQGSFTETLSHLDDAHVLADAFFRSSFRDSPASPILLDATERAKSLERMAGVIEALRAAGVGRSHRLVAIGGGVIQDIAAFVASIYMRGLPWDYLPTTVLAMVDSCIGGKSSINVGPYKNLVGTFHPPRRISIDPELAETLPRDQFASGLIEAAKICFCRGPESFAKHLACEPSLTMNTAALEAVILNSLLAKKHFIEIDEFDKKERLLLNFGHTFGHALEGASHYGIPHGIAVGIGILCSLAFQRGRGIEPAGAEPLEAHLLQMIRALPTLSRELRALDLDDVLDRFASDKKHTRSHYMLILIAAGGEVGLERIPRSGELEASLRRAISGTMEALSL
jgi:3-dehydroquinate synthase